MKTIIDWFWNLGIIINITPVNFWWVVVILILPIVIIFFTAKKHYKTFWSFVSVIYTGFALFWALNLGWNFKENQYEKNKSIDGLTSELTSKEIQTNPVNVNSVMNNEITISEQSIDNFAYDTLTHTIKIDDDKPDTIKVNLKNNSTLNLIIK